MFPRSGTSKTKDKCFSVLDRYKSPNWCQERLYSFVFSYQHAYYYYLKKIFSLKIEEMLFLYMSVFYVTHDELSPNICSVQFNRSVVSCSL